MPIDRLALLDDQAEPHVVELIPGEHYVVFFGTGDTVLPSEEGIEELRVLAYARRNKETLGTTGIQVAETLAEVVAAGVATNAIWVQCQAAARYVKQRRAASQARSLNGPDEVTRRALAAIQAPGIPLSDAPAAASLVVSAPLGERPWEISCPIGGRTVHLQIEATGVVVDVIIDPMPSPVVPADQEWFPAGREESSAGQAEARARSQETSSGRGQPDGQQREPVPTESKPVLRVSSGSAGRDEQSSPRDDPGRQIRVFERFTDRCRRAMVLAQDEARVLHHDSIGPEHLLLGLLKEGQGVAAEVLESLGVNLEAVRHWVEEIHGRGEQAPAEHIPFTLRAKKVIDCTMREADQLGHCYVGTEHLLLGLVHEGEGIAAQVLIMVGADLARIRERVIQQLHAMGLVSSASCWQFLALPSVIDRLAATFSFESTGVGSVCFHAPKKRAFRKPEQVANEVLNAVRDKSIQPTLEADSYGFTWMIIRRPPGQFGSLVNDLRTVNLEMMQRGLSSSLLCSVVAFRGPSQRHLAIVHLSRQGTFYPFAPLPGEKRDNVLELDFKHAVEGKLPIEADLGRWFPIWSAPGL